MSRKNAHIPILAGNLRFSDLFVNQQTFGRGNLELESVCHQDKLPIHLFGSFENVLNGALHVERLLR